MSKYFKFLVLAIVAVGLMAGSAFGAAALNAGNTTLSAEKISPTTDYPAAAINTAYQTGGPVAATTVIRVSLTNGKFSPGDTIGIWDGSLGDRGNAVVPAVPNNTRVDITLTSPLASGTVYQIVNYTSGFPLTGVSVPAGSAADTTVTLNVDSLTIPGDPSVAASATAITVKKQFSATLTSVTSKLSFADNMETFIASGGPAVPKTTSTESQAALLIVSDESINDKVPVAAGGGSCKRQLFAADSIDAKVTGGLIGISNVEYEGIATTTYAVTATDRTNGYATLAVAGDDLSICYSTDTPQTAYGLELTAADVAGTSIAAGTRTAQITLKGGGSVAAGYSRDLVAAGTTSHVILLDATQTHIQHIKADAAAGVETYIVVQSKSNVSGANAVRVEILASDGSMVSYDAGTITPGIPKVIKGSDLKAAVEADGKTVAGAIGFAAILTVNTPSEDLFGYAAYVTPTHTLRVPLD